MITEIPNKTGYLGKNGVFYSVFDSIDSFIQSNEKEAVIYAYCNSVKKKGKRFIYNVDLLFGTIEFFNVEHTSIGWVRHEVEEIQPSKAYRLLIERNSRCINDFQIKLCKEIKPD